ncbi:hypothetical protein P3T76_002395 [Phytophthora citrophthora]|uniref:RxLR effector protein n=1 Tax=Phytophthora citrophthora TaxID=4793 RepID=A0AAD9GYZ0_9STRA|nr:hypothetical protein P3T76_002395 [Phytophthora citrophthora]
MRSNYLVLFIAATLATSTNSLPITDNSIQVNNVATDSSPTIVHEDHYRYLKSSKKKVTTGGDEDEERWLPSGLTKVKDMFKKLPSKIGAKYLKMVEAYWAKNPKLRAQANM